MRRYWSLAISVLLLASAIGMWRLDTESIWHDEAWSIRAIRSPFGTPDDNTPPLYYLTLHGLHLLGIGESPFALRYGSILIFLLTVALGFRVAHRWYGLPTATLAGFLLAISPLLWEYAQEVRAYIAIPFFALLLLALADYLIRAKRIPLKAWALVFFSELAVLYTHNLSVPLIAWLNVVMFAALGWQLLKNSSSLEDRSKLIQWFGLQAVLFVLYIPWLTSQSPSGTRLNTVPVFGRKLSQDLWRGYILPVVVNPDDLPERMIVLSHLLPLLAAISLVILAWRGRSWRNLLIFSQVVLLPTFSTLLLQRASIDFHPRYYILAIPATMLLLVVAVAALPRSVQIVGVVLVAGVMGYISYQTLTFIADNRQYQHDDFRGMAEYYATLPADSLIIVPYEDEPTFTSYFFDKLDVQADLLLMPLYTSTKDAVARINAELEKRGASHIELLTWFQVPADERGMYACLLGGSSQQVGKTYQTYGLSTTGYEITQPIAFTKIPVTGIFDSALSFGEASQNAYGASYTTSENGTCLQTVWQLSAPAPEDDYHAAARILSPTGWEIAASDGLILRDDQDRVGDWQVGDTGESFLLLTLPNGAPSSNYNLLLRQYTLDNPSGFDLLERAAPVGKDLHFEVALTGNPFDVPPSEVTVSQDNISNMENQIFSGQWLELEIVNPHAEETTLMLQGEDWSLEQTIPAGEPSLFWTSFQIPPDAEGQARLTLNDTELAVYDVILTDRLFTLPDVGFTVDRQFGNIATLAGATVGQNDDTIDIELVWQSLGTTNIDYVVFVQLVDANGQFLTGSDSQPATAQRPTSSWVSDEYIKDSHTIKVDGLNYTGSATLIAGLYNPSNGQRLQLPDGSDFANLPVDIMVR